MRHRFRPHPCTISANVKFSLARDDPRWAGPNSYLLRVKAGRPGGEYSLSHSEQVRFTVLAFRLLPNFDNLSGYRHSAPGSTYHSTKNDVPLQLLYCLRARGHNSEGFSPRNHFFYSCVISGHKGYTSLPTQHHRKMFKIQIRSPVQLHQDPAAVGAGHEGGGGRSSTSLVAHPGQPQRRRLQQVHLLHW